MKLTAGNSSLPKNRRVREAWVKPSTARHDEDDLQLVPVANRHLGVFPLMQGHAIVLHQDRALSPSQAIEKPRKREGFLIKRPGLTIQSHFHHDTVGSSADAEVARLSMSRGAKIASSQSFHTGSKPCWRSIAATATGER